MKELDSAVVNNRYSKCTIAKPEKVDFYSQCFPEEGKYVNIEGPEFV
jgi:hypothetical protein